MPLFHLELFVLNSRGGPWFDQANPSILSSTIEDHCSIPLYVKFISDNVIHLHPKEITCARLKRRAHLHRLEWCVKGAMKHFHEKRKSQKESSFSLVYNDTPIYSEVQDMCFYTFETHFNYKLSEAPHEGHDEFSYLNFQLDTVRVSYSYLFSYLNGHKHSPIRNSIFDLLKIKNLKAKMNEIKVPWKESYWSLDIVLQYLIEGSDEDIASVVAVLTDYEMEKSSRKLILE
jgi:hypothetical protein